MLRRCLRQQRERGYRWMDRLLRFNVCAITGIIGLLLGGCDLHRWEEPRLVPGYGRLYIVVDPNGSPLEGMMSAWSEYSGWPARARLYLIRDGQCVLPEVVDRGLGGGSSLLGFGEGTFLRPQMLNPINTEIEPLVPGFVEVSRTGKEWLGSATELSGDEDPVPVTITMRRAWSQDEYERIRWILTHSPWRYSKVRDEYFKHDVTKQRVRDFAEPYLRAMESLSAGRSEDETKQLTPLPVELRRRKEGER